MILKQQKLLQLLVENGRNSTQRSLRQLILEAGYSKSAADNPAEIFNSRSWQDMIAEIPMLDVLGKLVKNALQERSIHGSNEAIDKLLKITGGYAPAKMQLVTAEDEMSDEELDREIAILEARIASRKTQEIKNSQ